MVDQTGPGDSVEHVRHVGVGRQQARVLLFLNAVILLSGVIIGACGTVVVYRDKIWRPAMIGSEDPEQTARRMAYDMERKYGLTAEQRKSARAAIQEHLEVMGVIRTLHNEDLRDTLAKLLAAIKKILTEEQYNEWRKEFDARRKMAERGERMRREGFRGGGGPRGPGGSGGGGPGDMGGRDGGGGGRIGPGGPGVREGSGFRGGGGGGPRGPGGRDGGSERFRGGMGGWMMGPMENLNLSEEQKQQIRLIQEQSREKAGGVEGFDQRREIMSQMGEAVAEVLNDEQREQWGIMQDEMRQRFEGFGDRRFGEGFRPRRPGDFNDPNAGAEVDPNEVGEALLRP